LKNQTPASFWGWHAVGTINHRTNRPRLKRFDSADQSVATPAPTLAANAMQQLPLYKNLHQSCSQFNCRELQAGAQKPEALH
jgi:hypothetical protein